MSFIAGYILGCGEGGDKRAEKLDALGSLCQINIDDEWSVRIKIASDIDNSQFFQFGNTHGGIVNYITHWTLYYCVYHNDKFRYATCQNPFYMKYQENYQNADKPNRLYYISRNSGFQVKSAEATFYTGGEFLRVSLKGTFTNSITAYSWTNDADRIEGETTISTSSFSSSKSDFDGSQYGGHYIVNGNADDFKNYVYGLYAVCRTRALAEKS